MTENPIIRTDQELDALCAKLRAAGRFALDTEFVGERTYVPRLCLIQVATPEFIALVDTLAVHDMAPFWALIAVPTVCKVLHAAREDLRLAFYGSDRHAPQGIFDTQIAAGLIGLPQYPLSYAKLVEALTGVKLSKGETRSEWDRRPLTPEQVQYARDDVRYLLAVADKLNAILERLGRAEWMQEEMQRFSEPGTYEADPELAYFRVRGSRAGLTARPATRLRALAAWRERLAFAQDVPARSVLRDEALTELALHPPRRLTDFARLRNFPGGEEAVLGPGILQALEAALAVADDTLAAPLTGQPAETPQERVRADLLYGIGESLCLERDLAPDLVLTKNDALALAQNNETPLLSGWRRQAVGEELHRLVSGSAAARIRMTDEGARVEIV